MSTFDMTRLAGLVPRGGLGCRPLFLVVALWVWWSGPFHRGLQAAHAFRGKTFGDIEIKQQPLLSRQQNFHGYVEYRFSVSNRSSNQSHTVGLLMGSHSNRYHHLRRLSRSVVVGAGARVLVSMMQPAVNLSSYSLIVTIDNATMGAGLPLLHAHRYYNRGSRRKSVVVLLGQQVKGAVSLCGKTLMNHFVENKYKRKYRKQKFFCQRASIPTGQWSPSWLAYTRYDGILLRASELEMMSPSVRAALLRYVESGGTLGVLGHWKRLPEWARSSASAKGRFYPGFGQIIAFREAQKLYDLQSFDYRVLSAAFATSLKPFLKTYNAGKANRFFPVIKNLMIPVRGIFLVMLLFSLAIGPFTLWLLWRKKKRIMMLFIVPTASLFACLLVFFYAIFSEGWYGYERTASVTVLEQGRRHATTLGWTAFYMPITPGDGISFSYNTELSAQIALSYWRQDGRALTVNWDHQQKLSTGWIASRLPLHFKFRKSQVRRERLLVTSQPNGSIYVTNGLGREIKRLWFSDRKGRLFSLGSPLAPGAKRTLTPWLSPSRGKIFLGPKLRKLRSLYDKNWIHMGKLLTGSPERYLRPGTYIAELKRSPFVDSHAASVRNVREVAVVYGILKGSRYGS